MKILHLSITVFASMLLIYESYATTFASSSEAKICLTDFFGTTQSPASHCTNSPSGGLTENTNNQWSFNCQLGGDSLELKGLAFCSSDILAGGTVTDNITSGDFNDGVYEASGCWCKMTYPFASQWVFYGRIYSGSDRCFNRCASACISAVAWNADNYSFAMRTLMFNNQE